ncbi:MAG: LamG-like jellyroll fold domain-containing protein [Planctomycetota bacterium]
MRSWNAPWVCIASAVALTFALMDRGSTRAHEGPDPRASWLLDPSFLSDSGVLKSQAGPDLTFRHPPRAEKVGKLECLRFDSAESILTAKPSWEEVRAILPDDQLTISAWVSIDETQDHGGIISAFQDNGNFEQGWVLGYNRDTFTFGLATTGSDDGDGKMTYLAGKTSIERGKWYHVCGIYDGESMQLWVNGTLDGESREQHGKILYPPAARLALAAYLDQNESFPLIGRLAQVVVYDVAAKPAWVAHDFEHQKDWVSLPPKLDPAKDFEFVVKPYLQFATQDRISVMCELSRKGRVTVKYGETVRFTEEVTAETDDGLLHTARLLGLKPETGYYYQVFVEEEGREETLRNDASSFQTASLPNTPFAFAVMGDTQGNPTVNGQLAQYAWALRPNFLLIPGDLVDDGFVKNQWVNEFFASMNPLFCRVPFFPVLGNHERNADHYYRYMDVPSPEYYYSFQYGNAMFFVIDSNKKLDPESEQYRWLERELRELQERERRGESDIVWKFVTYHHPSYSSDEDDYGNLWKGKSTWGDLRIRPMTELFDRYGVDIVWNGHIHSYERTWPLRDGKVVQKEGTVYMITGGGGGGLEQAGPIRPPFQNNGRRGHHFVFVAINGRTLEAKSYDLEGKLFDTWVIDKQVVVNK